MIPKAITIDLRNGMGLEETLVKHKTNLQELFQSNSNKCNSKYSVFDEWSQIQPTKHGTFRVYKYLYGHRIEFGSYRSHEDAILVRDELIKCDWDKNQLPRIIRELGIVQNGHGGCRR